MAARQDLIAALDKLSKSLSSRRVAVCVLCGGSSCRMGSAEPKQFLMLAGKTVLERSVELFERCPLVDEIIVVSRAADIERCRELTKKYKKLSAVVAGGDSRQQSAAAGLSAVDPATTHIVFHDAARPLTDDETIARVIRAAFRYRAASAATVPTDTIKEIKGESSLTEQKDRSSLRAVSTPQAFDINLYIAASEKAKKDNFQVTDDCSLAEHAGFCCRMVECGHENIKITYPHDIAAAEAIIASREKAKG